VALFLDSPPRFAIARPRENSRQKFSADASTRLMTAIPFDRMPSALVIGRMIASFIIHQTGRQVEKQFGACRKWRRACEYLIKRPCTGVTQSELRTKERVFRPKHPEGAGLSNELRTLRASECANASDNKRACLGWYVEDFVRPTPVTR
jgi:hypothetical protein